ncbi:MAG: tRNA (guanosine(46)-N7)-methyltransferase TrmB [Gammaproteobacteria bacterium]|nr:tRNA (guanosine(46)-N7)-methyltransferase TrmB [Gammaproteobacteria bacterium]
MSTDASRTPARSRPVRSFVKRQGRMTVGQRRALDELWPRFGVAFADQPLNLQATFGRSAPVTVEIGFGNGSNLLHMAQNSPEQDFLGIEVHEPGVGACLLGLERAGLQNVRLIAHDAIEVLQRRLAPASVQRINLFFPDPWPKKRHHKRRIVQDEFVALTARVLARDGLLHIVTDWEPYAEHIAEVLARQPEFAALAAAPADRAVSRFDARGQRLGHTNWERAWRLR